MTVLERFLKRSFDLLFSASGLIVFSPVLILCALIARFDSGGSGIYRQCRIGKGGRKFDVLKIRTMRGDATGVTVTVAHDNRITRSGLVFRRLKIDELPQLWNVFVGEMSFVGPRPDVPGYADRLNDKERVLLTLRPGITGPATLKYRNEEVLLARQCDPVEYNDTVVYPDKVTLNIEYLENYNIFEDFRYILMTLKIISIPSYLSTTKVDGEK